MIFRFRVGQKASFLLSCHLLVWLKDGEWGGLCYSSRKEGKRMRKATHCLLYKLFRAEKTSWITCGVQGEMKILALVQALSGISKRDSRAVTASTDGKTPWAPHFSADSSLWGKACSGGERAVWRAFLISSLLLTLGLREKAWAPGSPPGPKEMKGFLKGGHRQFLSCFLASPLCESQSYDSSVTKEVKNHLITVLAGGRSKNAYLTILPTLHSNPNWVP